MGKVDHLITVVEVMNGRVEKLDAAQEQTRKLERSMRRLALRLSTAALAMSSSRVVAAVAAPTRSLAAMAFGAFAGGFVGTILWQLLHAKASMAGILP